uniref:Uncharacterized protein n=1 Tax=Rhizophora mucronata TaxID=61149 RepID=A0A2P2IY09_RHIMU
MYNMQNIKFALMFCLWFYSGHTIQTVEIIVFQNIELSAYCFHNCASITFVFFFFLD